MRVGVYAAGMTRGLRGRDVTSRFLRQALAAVQDLQESTHIMVFTRPEDEASFGPFVRVALEQGSSLMPGRWNKERRVEKTLEDAGLDALLAPVDAPPPECDVPLVLLGVHFAALRENKGLLRGARQALARASALVVPCEHLRKQALEVLEVPLDRCLVAPPGVVSAFDIPQPPMVEPPYLLVYFDSLTAPAAPTLSRLLDPATGEFGHAVVVAGKGDDTGQDPWGDNVVRIEQCPNTTLASLYQHSAAMLYCSPYDGGAGRILEALRAGAPVVAPISRAMAELTGDVVVTFNPESPDSLIQAVRRAVGESKEQRDNRVRLGQRLTSKYSWEQTAWKLLAAFKRA